MGGVVFMTAAPGTSFFCCKRLVVSVEGGFHQKQLREGACSPGGHNAWKQLLQDLALTGIVPAPRSSPLWKQMSVFGCWPDRRPLPTWSQALAVELGEVTLTFLVSVSSYIS